MVYVFNWTNVRHVAAISLLPGAQQRVDLVGFSGEDLNIDGVEHDGNLVAVDSRKILVGPEDGGAPWFACKAVTVDGEVVYF